MNNKRVLIVDDDLISVHVLQKGLSALLYETETVIGGEQAIDYLQNSKNPPVDIILLDQLMGGMNGLDTFSKMKELKIDIPTIMITGHSSITLAIEFLKAGGDDFIEKPIPGFDILHLRIQHAIKSWQTKKALAEEKIQQALAEETCRIKSETLALLSHDIRSPIASLQMVFDRFSKQSTTMEDVKMIDLFQKAHQGISRIMGLISGTLVFSVLESGQFKSNFQKYDIVTVLKEAIEDCHASISEKQMSIQVHVKTPDTELAFDRNCIYRVFLNLISNAVKFCKTEGNISISIVDKEQNLVIAITDNGIGIPEDEIQSIFRPFVRSKRTNEGQDGCGLGLAICHDIVSAHQGVIWAENNVTGNGATFFL